MSSYYCNISSSWCLLMPSNYNNTGFFSQRLFRLSFQEVVNKNPCPTRCYRQQCLCQLRLLHTSVLQIQTQLGNLFPVIRLRWPSRFTWLSFIKHAMLSCIFTLLLISSFSYSLHPSDHFLCFIPTIFYLCPSYSSNSSVTQFYNIVVSIYHFVLH